MKLVAATHNPGKLAEFRRLFQALPVEVVSQRELCPSLEVEETGETFAQNAFLKASALCKATGEAAFGDDSGLCVDALGGAPGLYTARYGSELLGEKATDDDRMNLLLKRLEGVPLEKRTARFVCAICCVFPDGSVLRCEGTCEGYIGFSKEGDKGFGFDPVFYVGEKSFAQISNEEKDRLSHRGKAMEEFARQLALRFSENGDA